MITTMYEYYQMIKKMNISIIYSGPIWSEGIEGIGKTLKKCLAINELPLSASQAIFSVFVEQMMNILMYSSEKEAFDSGAEEQIEEPKGVFLLGMQNKTYFMQSGNIMKRENVEFLKSRIDYLNTLDKTELRKFYKEQIKKDNTNLESKGAGLGLIEIARRASSKIEYTFIPMENGLMFFTMYVTIG